MFQVWSVGAMILHSVCCLQAGWCWWGVLPSPGPAPPDGRHRQQGDRQLRTLRQGQGHPRYNIETTSWCWYFSHKQAFSAGIQLNIKCLNAIIQSLQFRWLHPKPKQMIDDNDDNELSKNWSTFWSSDRIDLNWIIATKLCLNAGWQLDQVLS